MSDDIQVRSEIISEGGRLYHLGVTPHEVATRIFLVGDPARAYNVAARFESIEHEIKKREYVTLTGRYDGLEMSVVGTGIGTDNVEIALVELHAAHSIELVTGLPRKSPPRLDFIRVGTSGGVSGDVAPGTLCVAEYAIGLDSTGPYYEVAPADRVVRELEQEALFLLSESVAPSARFRGRLPVYASRADPRVHELLVLHAERAKTVWASGITASSPGFFGASSRYVQGLVNTVPDIKGTLSKLEVCGRRVLNMEMESSLLFHLAGALGHRAATICPAVSQPDAAAEVIDYDERMAIAIDVALGAMSELAGAG